MPMNILIIIAISAVAIVLGIGLFTMLFGGEDRGNRSNKLMQLRVGLQALALVIVLLVAFFNGR